MKSEIALNGIYIPGSSPADRILILTSFMLMASLKTNQIINCCSTSQWAHEPGDRLGYLLLGHEDERSNCFSKNLVIGPNKDEKMLQFAWNNLFLALKIGAFRY